jgi:undecaprenyl-diphosphatase
VPESTVRATPSTRALLVAAVVAAGVFVVCWLAASGGRVPAIDRRGADWVNAWPDWFGFLEVPMQLGTISLLPAIAIGVWFLWRRPGPVVAIVAAAFVARGLANAAKDVVERGRPFNALAGIARRDPADGYGYPSAHAAVSAAVATIVFVLLPARWRWIPVVLAVLVALARVFVGVHFPLDVLGGAALGVAVGALAATVPGVRSRG